jgi:hypothetical protein
MKTIKNIAIGLFVLCALYLVSSFVSAQTINLTDLLNDMSNETTFGYNDNIKISIKEVTPQKVVIQSPIIVDELGGKIKTYTVMYGEYTMDQIIADTNLISSAKEKTFTFTGTEAILDMELNLYDGLDPAKSYYVRVIPKDQNGVGGQISTQDLRFKLNTQTYGEGINTGMMPPTALHAAAGANMALANITHSCTPDCTVPAKGSKKITLSWIAVAGSDSVDISLQDDTNGSFVKLANVNMSDEKYELQTSKNGEHIFKFVPNNGGTEMHYTVTIGGISASGVGTPTTPGITKVPKT